MRKLVDNLNIFHTENIRLVKNISKRESPDEYPEFLKWALQLLYFDGNRWIEICRIDNNLHEGIKGVHIHTYKQKDVKRRELTLEEAEKELLHIGKRILLKEFKEHLSHEEIT